MAMVEEECRRYRPTKNYLEHLPPVDADAFLTPTMAQEFERIQNRVLMETLSMKRYELPPPSAGRLSEISAWEEAIDNSKAQLEHQRLRSMNLEIMLEYSIEAWKEYLNILLAMQVKAQEHLQNLKKNIQDINWQRKQSQTKAGEQLRLLEATWVSLVSKNYEIEQQCVELEKKILEAQLLKHTQEEAMKLAQANNGFEINEEVQVNGEYCNGVQENGIEERNCPVLAGVEDLEVYGYHAQLGDSNQNMNNAENSNDVENNEMVD